MRTSSCNNQLTFAVTPPPSPAAASVPQASILPLRHQTEQHEQGGPEVSQQVQTPRSGAAILGQSQRKNQGLTTPSLLDT